MYLAEFRGMLENLLIRYDTGYNISTSADLVRLVLDVFNQLALVRGLKGTPRVSVEFDDNGIEWYDFEWVKKDIVFRMSMRSIMFHDFSSPMKDTQHTFDNTKEGRKLLVSYLVSHLRTGKYTEEDDDWDL